MSFHQQYLIVFAALCFFLLLLLLLFSPFSSLNYQHRSLLFEEKTRLGSTPPSCHNKCNGCHPCMAVQVPSIPSHHRVKPSHLTKNDLKLFDTYPSGNRYSNYKPLGWKCHCGGHFYNP
ncbi:hypothetical protein JCGZ_18644 [Jatropha curcas]|uniref:Epidermal patterning factor-like protein n=1 Tax=Jatropha curcas TaxID=180498 RepID=A0A067KD29_JATCU|nr:hypothetical protein JCGZ_18644 [Jatropha curcas]